jgi:hypothetical protein
MENRRHRLHLSLISTVSSLPLALLPSALAEIRDVVKKHDGEGEDHRRKKKELTDALFREILEKVGDREKEFVIRWWGEEAPTLQSLEEERPTLRRARL